MFPCFFFGFSNTFDANTSKSSQIISLVLLGSIIPSIKPLEAAANGFANLNKIVN